VTMSQLTSLPSELLIQICSHLNSRDLTSLSETCVSLYRLATDPTLWKYSFQIVPPYLLNVDPELYMNILSLRRFDKIRRIYLEISFITSLEQTEQLLEILKRKKWLKEVTFGECYLSNIPAESLVNLIKGIKNVIFDFGTRLNCHQGIEIFESIAAGNKIKSLYLEELDFSEVESKTFAEAVNSLSEFSSYFIKYKSEQVKEMFVKMAKKTNLKKLVFHHNSVEYVNSGILAKALNNLHDLVINLSVIPFTKEQVLEMFEQMAANKSHLKTLEILTYQYPDLWDFSFIPPATLSKAIGYLDEVYMTDIVFSNKQICQIFEELAKRDRKIVIDLGYSDLSQVPLELLERVVDKLEPNCFVIKLKVRILQICEETAKDLKYQLEKVGIENHKVMDEIETIRKEGKMLRIAAAKNKKLIFLLSPGVSVYYQKSKYSSRASYLRYSRHVKQPSFWRHVKLKNHVSDCKLIRQKMLNRFR